MKTIAVGFAVTLSACTIAGQSPVDPDMASNNKQTASFQQQDTPEITIAPATVPRPAATRQPQTPSHPVAKGMDLVDGAIVCSSYDLATWMYGQVNVARHATRSLSPEIRRQNALITGYDVGREPRLADWGCLLVPAGTPFSVEPGNGVPVVSGQLADGRKFGGVTLPAMVGR